MAGEYKWKDKTKLNNLKKVVKSEDLKIMCMAPESCVNTKALATVDYKKKSLKTEAGGKFVD